MKSKPQKYGHPGKVGMVNVKGGKAAPKGAGPIKGADGKRIGTSFGILSKHFK